MEIVRDDLGLETGERRNLIGFDRNDTVLVLQCPANYEKWLMHDGDVLFFK